MRVKFRCIAGGVLLLVLLSPHTWAESGSVTIDVPFIKQEKNGCGAASRRYPPARVTRWYPTTSEESPVESQKLTSARSTTIRWTYRRCRSSRTALSVPDVSTSSCPRRLTTMVSVAMW